MAVVLSSRKGKLEFTELPSVVLSYDTHQSYLSLHPLLYDYYYCYCYLICHTITPPVALWLHLAITRNLS